MEVIQIILLAALFVYLIGLVVWSNHKPRKRVNCPCDKFEFDGVDDGKYEYVGTIAELVHEPKYEEWVKAGAAAYVTHQLETILGRKMDLDPIEVSLGSDTFRYVCQERKKCQQTDDN